MKLEDMASNDGIRKKGSEQTSARDEKNVQKY